MLGCLKKDEIAFRVHKLIHFCHLWGSFLFHFLKENCDQEGKSRRNLTRFNIQTPQPNHRGGKAALFQTKHTKNIITDTPKATNPSELLYLGSNPFPRLACCSRASALLTQHHDALTNPHLLDRQLPFTKASVGLIPPPHSSPTCWLTWTRIKIIPPPMKILAIMPRISGLVDTYPISIDMRAFEFPRIWPMHSTLGSLSPNYSTPPPLR